MLLLAILYADEIRKNFTKYSYADENRTGKYHNDIIYEIIFGE